MGRGKLIYPKLPAGMRLIQEAGQHQTGRFSAIISDSASGSGRGIYFKNRFPRRCLSIRTFANKRTESWNIKATAGEPILKNRFPTPDPDAESLIITKNLPVRR